MEIRHRPCANSHTVWTIDPTVPADILDTLRSHDHVITRHLLTHGRGSHITGAVIHDDHIELHADTRTHRIPLRAAA